MHERRNAMDNTAINDAATCTVFAFDAKQGYTAAYLVTLHINSLSNKPLVGTEPPARDEDSQLMNRKAVY